MTGEKTCVLVPACMIASILHLVTEIENSPLFRWVSQFPTHVGSFFFPHVFMQLSQLHE